MAAHELAFGMLGTSAYARTRGVAQQAARLARATRLPRDGRARLLCAAWLHDLGDGRDTGRRLRAAGLEPLARIVAHRGFAAMQAAIAGRAPLSREFPVPAGADEGLLMLLDIAVVTTDADGVRATPARVLRELVDRVGPADPAVRAMVALVARLGEEPASRSLVELLGPPATTPR